jgi:hypothetical protein
MTKSLFALAVILSACSNSPANGAGDLGADLAGQPCPLVFGSYSMLMTSGSGCGDLSTSSSQCISAAPSACALNFVTSGGTGALSGSAMLQMDGTFTGAAITEGSGNRTGCTGAWDDPSQTLTVVCGGTDPASSQYCKVTMKRTAAGLCP